MVRAATLALVASLFPAAAHAQSPALVEAAVRAIEARAEPDQRWSFTRTVTRGGESFSARFDPSRPAEDAWTLVSQGGVEGLSKEMRRLFDGLADEEEPDSDVVLGGEDEEGESFGEQLGGAFALLREDDAEAAFTFAPSQVGSADEEPPDFLSALSGELIIDKAAPLISSMRIFAEESFKPAPIARITAFEVTMGYAEVEPGGPVAMVLLDTHVAGSALFQEFEEAVRIENSGFARTAVAPDEGAQPAE
jgi:hypothetical protein